jgi:hypothetical protein
MRPQSPNASVFARTRAAVNRKYSSTSGSPKLGTLPTGRTRHGMNDPKSDVATSSMNDSPRASTRDWEPPGTNAPITYISSLLQQ